MKPTHNIFIILVISVFFGCKKENKTASSQPSTNNAPAAPITVAIIPEQIGYLKVFNVMPRTVITPTNTNISQVTNLTAYTCTFAIIADTLLPNSITGKKYLITKSNGNATEKAYSYYNLPDSTWNFISLNPYSDIVRSYNLKLPLTATKSWTLNTPPYNDNYTCDSQSSQQINNVPSQCFLVNGTSAAAVNYQSYYYNYFINTKGAVKYLINFIYFSDPSQLINIQYELVMINSNF